jgi:sec-independent protein translocase protein TatA
MTSNLVLQVIGMEWIILIVVVIVLIFGARKIPELARSLGRAQGEFAKGKREAELEATSLETLSTEKTKEQETRLRLVKAASELGISAAGKSDEQLREEIRQALAK